jgi:hypothetical protein
MLRNAMFGPPSKCRRVSWHRTTAKSKPVIQPHGRSLLDIARALFRPCAIG